MSKKIKVIISVVIFAALFALAVFAYQALTSKYTPQSQTENPLGPTAQPKKIEAPDFAVTDLDGNTVHLSDFKGKPIVLNFWASWCGPCQSEMPHFNEVYRDKNGEVVFLMVNQTDGQRETIQKAQAFIDKEGYDFPIYFDTKLEASYLYGASSIPSTLFIDKEGYVSKGYQGTISKKTLEDNIALIE